MAEKSHAAEKSLAEQIEAHLAEADRLKALLQQAEKKEYPKWIADPADESGQSGRSVQNEEEERAVLVSYQSALAAKERKAVLDKKIAALKEQAEKEDSDEKEKTAKKGKK